MDDQTFWQLLAEYLANLQTTGVQTNPGGDWPYDDYGLQDQIGGFGGTPVNGYPYEDWADTGIAGSAGDQTAQPGFMGIGGFPPPSPARPALVPGAGSNPERSAQIGQVMAQLQSGLEQRTSQRGSAMQGGRATAQQVVRNLSQPKPRQQVVAPRQAAPTFAAPAQRAPAATPTRSSPAPAARNTATRIKR